MKTSQNNNERKDIYQEITNQIITALEKGITTGASPWIKLGDDNLNLIPQNAVSQKEYRGINILTLWISAENQGFTSGIWATYKQWKELGCNVRQGEKGTNVVFWKFLDEETDTNEEQKEDTKQSKTVMIRSYSVFNASQVDGYKMPEPLPEEGRILNAERFFYTLGVKIRHGGDRAYYSPIYDFIQMPNFSQFKDPISYYAVLSHEATHWTGAKKRLNRELENRFGKEAYAAEELIAELGAAFLCSELHLSNKPRPDHASYIASWLKVLKNDKRAIFTAASKAQQAVDYMKAQQLEQQAAA